MQANFNSAIIYPMKFFVKSNFLSKKTTIIFVLVVCSIFIFSLSVIDIKNVDAYGGSTWGDGSIYNVLVNSPVGILYPGQQFYFQISASANACGNRAYGLYLSAGGSLAVDPNCHNTTQICHDQNYNAFYNSSGIQVTATQRDPLCTTNCLPASSYPALTLNNYAVGPFTASSIPGTHGVNFNLLLDNYDNSNGALLTGTQSYTVACPVIYPSQIISPIYVGSPNSSGTLFSWSKLSNAVNYYMYKAGLTDFTYMGSIDNTNNSYYNSSLNAYYYNDTTQTSGSPSYRVVATLPSANTISLSAIPNAICHGGVTLSWRPVYYYPTPPQANQIFEVYRDNLLIATVNNTDISSDPITYTDTGVSVNSIHLYKVIAKNMSSCSDSVSNTVSVTYTNTCNITGTPPPPTASPSTDMGKCGSIDISWSDVQYAESYKVYKDGNITTPIETIFGTSTRDENLATSSYSTIPSPTGGVVTTASDGSTIHTFTSGGTFIVPTGLSGNVQVLVVGGGGGVGGGVFGTTWHAGGGGGQVVSNPSYAISSGAYAVTIGTGGGVSTNGGNSSFGTITALHGSTGYTSAHGGASGSLYAGGAWTGSGTGAGGGGGAGGAGFPNSGNTGGAGGVGVANTISGSSVTYGAGGKGGDGPMSINGTANTGTGGGGGSGTGGSGVVIISYVLGRDLIPTNWHTYAVQAVNSVSSSDISSFSSAEHSSASCLPAIAGGGCDAYLNNHKIVTDTSSSTPITWKATSTISGGDGSYRYLWSDSTDSRVNNKTTSSVGPLSYPTNTNLVKIDSEHDTSKKVGLRIYSGYGVQERFKEFVCPINVWSTAPPISGVFLEFSSGPLYVNRSLNIRVNTRGDIRDEQNNPVNLDESSLVYSWNGGEATTSSSSPMIFTKIGNQYINVTITGLLQNNKPFIGSYSTTTNIMLPSAPNTEQ